jgi:hypothetical protein
MFSRHAPSAARPSLQATAILPYIPVMNTFKPVGYNLHLMFSKNVLKCIPPYLAVWAGLFLFQNAWLAMFGLHIAILLVLASSRPNPPVTTLFTSRTIKWILLNTLLCGASGFALYYLLPWFVSSKNLTTQLSELGLNRFNLPIFIAYFSLLNPVVEEYFWRVSLGNETKGFYIGDLLYAGYHAIVLVNQVPILITLLAMACLTFIGWFWRQVRREDGGSLAPVLGHMAADLSVMLAVYLLIR